MHKLLLIPDIDECSTGAGNCGCANGISGCSASCTNNDGSYECVCSTGYVLFSDGATCIGKNKQISPS